MSIILVGIFRTVVLICIVISLKHDVSAAVSSGLPPVNTTSRKPGSMFGFFF